MNLDKLSGTQIYGWKTTKSFSSMIGLTNFIGTEGSPLFLNSDQSRRVWNTECEVTGVEVLMDVQKIYITYESKKIFLTHSGCVVLRFGVWIKVPKDKESYLKIRRNCLLKSNLGKRKRKDEKNSNDEEDEDDDEPNGPSGPSNGPGGPNGPPTDDDKFEYDLLLTRSLKDLFKMTEKDAYIQLGDLRFCAEQIPHIDHHHKDDRNLASFRSSHLPYSSRPSHISDW